MSAKKSNDTRRENSLFQRVAEIIEAVRGRVARSVNTAMVHAYWSVGKEIVEVEQAGEHRASYGEQVIAQLARRLAPRFGRGFSVPNLRKMRQFFLAYPVGSLVPAELRRGPFSSLRPRASNDPIRSTLSSELKGSGRRWRCWHAWYGGSYVAPLPSAGARAPRISAGWSPGGAMERPANRARPQLVFGMGR